MKPKTTISKLLSLSLFVFCFSHCASQNPGPVAAALPGKAPGKHPFFYSLFEITSVSLNGDDLTFRPATASDRGYGPAIEGEGQYLTAIGDEAFLFFPTAYLDGKFVYLEITAQEDDSALEIRSGTALRGSGAGIEHPINISPFNRQGLDTSLPLPLRDYGGVLVEFAAKDPGKKLHQFRLLFRKDGKVLDLIIEAVREDKQRREWPTLRHP